MPDVHKLEGIVNLKGFHVEKVLRSNPLILQVVLDKERSCPYCQKKRLRLKDTWVRQVRHESFGVRDCYLRFKSHKFQCLSCKRYFNQRFPGILPRYRVTEAFRKEVSLQHHYGIDRQKVASQYGLGWATIERWYQNSLRLKLQEYSARSFPRVLGIDEHFFTRKKGYATTFADLVHNRVYDVALGRSETSLKGFLTKTTDRYRTQAVIMDLSETYRMIAKKYFPNAMIIADRFHVIRLVNHQFMQTWKQLDPIGRKNRGLLSLMRRHHHKLSTDQKRKLRSYLRSVAGLEIIYDFKQSLCKLLTLKTRTKKQCKKLIPQFLKMIDQLKETPFESLRSLGKTLDRWKEEIVRMWRFRKTNSITEGLHNKMEVISRRSYGFRNFQNYRLRVKVLCA